MHPVPGTYKLLGLRAMDIDGVDDWVDWAMEMLEAGFDGEALAMVAGLTAPMNRFQLMTYGEAALAEQQIEVPEPQQARIGYAYHLAREALAGRKDPASALRELHEIGRDHGLEAPFGDFYFLYFAKQELQAAGEQYYWPGAHAGNIDAIIQGHLRKWVAEFEAGSHSA